MNIYDSLRMIPMHLFSSWYPKYLEMSFYENCQQKLSISNWHGIVVPLSSNHLRHDPFRWIKPSSGFPTESRKRLIWRQI